MRPEWMHFFYAPGKAINALLTVVKVLFFENEKH
jgi:hypothetical protein